MPCAVPSAAHPIEEDARPSEAPAQVPMREREKPMTSQISEKPVAAPAEAQPAVPSSSSATSTTIVPEHKPAVAPLVPVPVPTSPPAEPEEVVPPSPKPQLLTQEESEGVLSGSVQPIGSTGTESDGETSFTDDDEAAKEPDEQVEDDDEERLIMQGGAGIPIGPVSNILFAYAFTYSYCTILGWPAEAFIASDRPISCRAKMSSTRS